MSEMQPKFLSERDAAKFLSISNKTLQRLRTKGGGPAFCKLGGRGARIVYPVDALTGWAMERCCQSTSEYTKKDGSCGVRGRDD